MVVDFYFGHNGHVVFELFANFFKLFGNAVEIVFPNGSSELCFDFVVLLFNQIRIAMATLVVMVEF